MKKKYVYLYEIILSKKNEDPLYYYGIRFGFDGNVEEDEYMGSPYTHKSLWEDSSYTKTKNILQVGTFSNHNELRDFANTEIQIIKDAWDKYGVYGKGGRCLNAQAGRVFIHTKEVRDEIARKLSEYWTGNPDHPMKRPEVKTKQAKSMSRYLLQNPKKNPNNLPGVKEKQRKSLRENNPMHRPEIRAKVTGKNNPMYGKKHTEEVKKKISDSVNKSITSETRKKLSEKSKEMWSNPEHRAQMREFHKKRWQKIKEQKLLSNSLEKYFD